MKEVKSFPILAFVSYGYLQHANRKGSGDCGISCQRQKIPANSEATMQMLVTTTKALRRAPKKPRNLKPDGLNKQEESLIEDALMSKESSRS